MNPVYVKLVASDAKVQAAAIIEKLRRGENVEVGNYEVLAWVNAMLLWVCNKDLMERTQYYRKDEGGGIAIYTPEDMDKSIQREDDIRPPVLEPKPEEPNFVLTPVKTA
jgi:hypothetical protein